MITETEQETKQDMKEELQTQNFSTSNLMNGKTDPVPALDEQGKTMSKAANQSYSFNTINVPHPTDGSDVSPTERLGMKEAQRTSTILGATMNLRQSQHSNEDLSEVITAVGPYKDNELPSAEQSRKDFQDIKTQNIDFSAVDVKQQAPKTMRFSTKNPMDLVIKAKPTELIEKNSVDVEVQAINLRTKSPFEKHSTGSSRNMTPPPWWPERSAEPSPITTPDSLRLGSYDKKKEVAFQRKLPNLQKTRRRSPRQIILHQQATLERSQESQVQAKGSFPQRKAKRNYQAMLRENQIRNSGEDCRDSIERPQTISDSRSKSRHSRSRSKSPPSILAITDGVQKDLLQNVPWMTQQPANTTGVAPNSKEVLVLFSQNSKELNPLGTQQFRPTMEPAKYTIPAFFSQKQKGSSPLNIQVRARTTPFQVGGGPRRKIQNDNRFEFQRVMNIVESSQENNSSEVDNIVFNPRSNHQSQNRKRLLSVNTETMNSAASHPSQVIEQSPNKNNLVGEKGEEEIKEEHNNSIISQEGHAEAEELHRGEETVYVVAKTESVDLNEHREFKSFQSNDHIMENEREMGLTNSVMTQERTPLPRAQNKSQPLNNFSQKNRTPLSQAQLDSQNKRLELQMKHILDNQQQERANQDAEETSPDFISLKKPAMIEAKAIIVNDVVTEKILKLQKTESENEHENNLIASSADSRGDVNSQYHNSAKKTKNIQSQSYSMVFSPKNHQTMINQQAFETNQNRFRQDYSRNLPTIVKSQQNSLFISDTNTSQIISNKVRAERVSQIFETGQGIPEAYKRQLPQDKSFMVYQKGALTRTLKPKALKSMINTPPQGQMTFIPPQKILEYQRHQFVFSPTFGSRAQKYAHDRQSKETMGNSYIQGQTLWEKSKCQTANNAMYGRDLQKVTDSSFDQQQRRDTMYSREGVRTKVPLRENRSSQHSPLRHNDSIQTANQDLMDGNRRLGSRLQRNISPGKDSRNFQVDQSGSFNATVPVGLKSNVKEWLHDPEQKKELGFKKHQEVLAKRSGMVENYKGKKSFQNQKPSSIRVGVDVNHLRHQTTSSSNYSNHAPVETKSPYNRQDTLRMIQQSPTKQEHAGSSGVTSASGQQEALGSQLRRQSVQPANDELIIQPRMSSVHHYSSIQQKNATGTGDGKRSKGKNKQIHANSFIDKQQQQRAISPKLKKNLLVNLPSPKTRLHTQGRHIQESIQPIQTDLQVQETLGSRAENSLIAPTLEAFSNTDNVSDEQNRREKRNQQPVSQVRIIKPKSRQYTDIIPNEFTVIGNSTQFQQKIVRSPDQNRSFSPNSKKKNVPRIEMGAAAVKKNLHNQKARRNTKKFAEDHQRPNNSLTTRTMPPEELLTPQEDERLIPAPLHSGRNEVLLESSKDECGSPGMDQSLIYSTNEDKHNINDTKETLLSQVTQSDRKALLNCLENDDEDTINKNGSTVLTRLLKGQNLPDNKSFMKSDSISINNGEILNLEDITSMKKTKLIESGVITESQQEPETVNLLFHLNTLYSVQSQQWKKYDEQWALFEKDHIRNQAPIPSSAQFLLIHLIQQVQNKSAYLRQKKEGEYKSLQSSQETIELNPIASQKQIALHPKNALFELGQKLTMLGNQKRQSQKPPESRTGEREGKSSQKSSIKQVSVRHCQAPQPKKAAKVPGYSNTTLDVLDEAYRMARIRLQMCQGNLLFKFNDDDRRIFAELRSQLCETYDRLKSSTTCVL